MSKRFVRINGVRVQQYVVEKSHRITTIGARFVIGETTYVVCECSCGNVKVVAQNQITRQATKSCGCLREELSKQRFTKHGDARGGLVTAEHMAWQHILHRTSCNTGSSAKDYVGRGISTCKRWQLSYADFLADMGRRPGDKTSIDRIENNGHYSCGKCEECTAKGWTSNCRWATALEQNNNKRNVRTMTFYGKTMSIAEWCRVSQIPHTTVYQRLHKLGWSEKDAVWTPLQPPKFKPSRVA